MLYNTLHQKWPRLIACVLGELVVAFSLNFLIVPLGLYSGGAMGVCQLIRTLLVDYAGLDFGAHDIAGILYFLVNIPILVLAYKNLGRTFVVKTGICVAAYTLFYSVIPVARTMVVNDYLTCCLLGGILTGIGSGIVLTCGGSGGGLDIIGLTLSKRGSKFTVGKFSLTFNFFLYAVCLLLFSPEIAIYSVIYNVMTMMVLDKMHQQNINVQVLIFTRADEKKIAQAIFDEVGRGVTWWEGTGAYTGKDVHVLCVCLSKYEIEELLHVVHTIDPNAFLTTQEGTRIYGNFTKKLD